jgi:hypothetical protein
MKQVIKNIGVFFVLTVVFFTSCISLQDREMTSSDLQLQVLGKVEARFASFHFLHIQIRPAIKKIAYDRLMDEAKKKYAGTYGADVLDIKNITIEYNGKKTFLFGEQGFELWFIALLPLPVVILCDWQVLDVKGTVVINPNKQKKASKVNNPSESALERAIERSAETLVGKLPKGSTVAVLNISSANNTENLIQELEYRLVQKGKDLIIVDRRRLAQIRIEQAFQISGDVSDASAVSIGNMLGATVVITGNITTSGNKQILRLTALDVQTAQIIESTREEI